MRRGPVTVVHLPAPPASETAAMAADRPTRASSEPTVRAAYGIGRKVGNAVVRNRVRRRLRAILRELDRDPAQLGGDGGLVPGTYLVTVRPEAASLPYAELQRHVVAACAAVGGREGQPRSGTSSGAAAGRHAR